jgi:hypothetical protein
MKKSWPRVALSLAPLVVAAPCTLRAAPCTAPAYHAFDFWLGNWDVYDGATLTAHARITSVQNGCALREEFQSLDGSSGESLSAWDESSHVWRQNWISNHGSIVALSGGPRSGSMILAGPESGSHSPDQVRGTWKPEPTGVREIGERSTDNGQTWQPWFDLHFRRSAPR